MTAEKNDKSDLKIWKKNTKKQWNKQLDGVAESIKMIHSWYDLLRAWLMDFSRMKRT